MKFMVKHKVKIIYEFLSKTESLYISIGERFGSKL